MKNGLLGLLTTAALAVFAVILSGCAQSGPVLLQDIMYQAPTGTSPERPKVVVGVSPFKEVRGGSTSVLGKRTISDDVQNDLVVQGTVAPRATALNGRMFILWDICRCLQIERVNKYTGNTRPWMMTRVLCSPSTMLGTDFAPSAIEA